MRWLTALLVTLCSTAALAAGGQNRALPRGPVFGEMEDFPYFSGGAAAGSTNDSNFWISPYLANPVWKGAADAQVMVTGTPNEAARFRVKWGTSSTNLSNTVVACWQDRTTIAQATENPCNIPANTRFDFLLSGMAENTRIYYQVERSTNGGTTWSGYPQASFMTLASATGTDQHFVYVSDEHLTGVYGTAECGNADTQGNWARLQQTFANILTNNATHNYRFYLTTGDTALTHLGDESFHPCMNVMGKSPHLDNVDCGGLPNNCDGSATTQNEADARWINYLRHMQPVTKYLPLVITLGNHEGETQYTEQVANLAQLSGLNGANSYWYFDATNNLETYSRLARLKYFPNPDFTYDGTSGNGSANGNYFSLASGSFELIISDIEGGPPNNLGGGGARSFPSDFPGACATAVVGDDGSYIACTGTALDPAPYDRGPKDWAYDEPQCDFLTGAASTADGLGRGQCNDTAGRMGAAATTWTDGVDTITGIKWKFMAAHHGANSSSGEVTGKLYARGSMGNQDRICSTLDSDDGVGEPWDRRGGFCTSRLDCDTTFPFSFSCCDPGESGACVGDQTLAQRNTGNLSGYQNNLQIAAKAWSAAAGKKFFFLYGHDHLSTCAQKHDGGGATGVYYCEGTQPGGTVDGPSWMDNDRIELVYDWGGLDNQPDGLPDYCSAATVNGAIHDGGDLEITACDTTIHGDGISTNSLGSTVRGYIDVWIDGTNDVTIRQYDTVLTRDTNLDALINNNDVEWSFVVP